MVSTLQSVGNVEKIESRMLARKREAHMRIGADIAAVRNSGQDVSRQSRDSTM